MNQLIIDEEDKKLVVDEHCQYYIEDYLQSKCERDVAKHLKKMYGFDNIHTTGFFNSHICYDDIETEVDENFIGEKEGKFYLFNYKCHYSRKDGYVAINDEKINQIDKFDNWLSSYGSEYYVFKKSNDIIIYNRKTDETKKFILSGEMVPGHLSLPNEEEKTIFDVWDNFLSLVYNEAQIDLYLNTITNSNGINLKSVKVGMLPDDGTITRLEPLDNNYADARAFNLIFPHVVVKLTYDDEKKRLLILKKDGSECILSQQFDKLNFTSGYICKNKTDENNEEYIEAYHGLGFIYQIGDEIGEGKIDEQCNISLSPLKNISSSRYQHIQEILDKESPLAETGLNIKPIDSKKLSKTR